MCSTSGGLRFGVQMYNKMAAHLNAYFIALSVVASFLLPAVFHASFSSKATADYRVAQVSRGASAILLILYFFELSAPINDALVILESIPQNVALRAAAREIDPSSKSWGSDSDGQPPSVGAARRFRDAENRGEKVRRSAGFDKGTNVSSETAVAASKTSDFAGNNLETSSYIRPEDIRNLADFERQRQAKIEQRAQDLRQPARQGNSPESAHRVSTQPYY